MTKSSKTPTQPTPKPEPSAAAKRALAEAQARREQIDAINKQHADEVSGRGGLDPARFGDWEVKGIASDF
jgi:hypothetical protein